MNNLSNLELEITNLKNIDNVLFIDYLNKTSNNILQERIELDGEFYKNLFETFFTEVPVFISDRHKQIIKSLNFVKINKEKEINIEFLNNYFKNEDNVLKVLNYFRTRKDIILAEKSKWKNKKLI
jgi:hypothetical protein